MISEIIVPYVSDQETELQIVVVHKLPYERVEMGEIILEVVCEKVVIEVESGQSGWISDKLLFFPGHRVKQGQVIGYIAQTPAPSHQSSGKKIRLLSPSFATSDNFFEISWHSRTGEQVAPKTKLASFKSETGSKTIAAPFGGQLCELFFENGDLVKAKEPIGIFQKDEGETSQSDAQRKIEQALNHQYIRMPPLPEGSKSAELRWHKREGEHIKQGEVLFAIRIDDKWNGFTSRIDGKLKEQIFKTGERLSAGYIIGVQLPA